MVMPVIPLLLWTLTFGGIGCVGVWVVRRVSRAQPPNHVLLWWTMSVVFIYGTVVETTLQRLLTVSASSAVVLLLDAGIVVSMMVGALSLARFTALLRR